MQLYKATEHQIQIIFNSAIYFESSLDSSIGSASAWGLGHRVSQVRTPLALKQINYFTHYTSARGGMPPMMLAVINNSKIKRVDEMGM